MAIYTFRPEKCDEPSLLMRFVNLPSDSLARAHAKTVLASYPRFGVVQVWDGERLVGAVSAQGLVQALT